MGSGEEGSEGFQGVYEGKLDADYGDGGFVKLPGASFKFFLFQLNLSPLIVVVLVALLG